MADLARTRLRAARLKDAGGDEEDAALSAFESLYAGLANGKFPQLNDRDDLWRLLVVITSRKVLLQARRQLRQKRGGGAAHFSLDWQTADIGDVGVLDLDALFRRLRASYGRQREAVEIDANVTGRSS